MASVVDALGNSLFANTVPVDQILSKFEEEAGKARKEIQDKVEVKENSLGEISKLQSVLTKVKNVASSLADPLQTGFSAKTARVATQEAGLPGSDFLTNVQVDNSAIGGATKVAVARVATQSDLVLRNGVGDNNGFATDGAIELDGDLTLTLAGAAVQVTFVVGDSLDDAINKINTGLLAGNHAFEAFKLQGAGDTGFIEVRAKNTGVASAIVLTAYDDNTAGGVTGVAAQSLVDGVDADVYVNGISHQQASNKFVNIVPGVSFEVTRQNAVNNGNGVAYGNVNYNTINVSEDKSAVKKMIADFGDAMSELSYLAAKNKQSSKSISDFQFADPTSDYGSFDSEDSPLRGSSLLSEVEDL